MKYLKIFESFEYEKINEEWFPRGPFISLKSNNDGTIAQFYDTKLGTEIEFIGGKKGSNHIEEIKAIISSLSSDKNVETLFDVNGLDDCSISGIYIHSDNLKNYNTEEEKTEFVKYLETLGEIKYIGGYNDDRNIHVKLNNPIEVIISEGEQKDRLRFHKKLDELQYKLENSDLPSNKESNELLDKLIGMFSKEIDEDEDEG